MESLKEAEKLTDRLEARMEFEEQAERFKAINVVIQMIAEYVKDFMRAPP